MRAGQITMLLIAFTGLLCAQAEPGPMGPPAKLPPVHVEVDVVVLNVGEPPSLLLNTSRTSNHRVLFHLVGTKSNRAATGARVTVHAGSLTQFDEVRGGASYLSQNDLRLHFGLGLATKMESVEIRWPSSKSEVLNDLSADKIYTIVEGAGIKDSVPFSDLPTHLP